MRCSLPILFALCLFPARADLLEGEFGANRSKDRPAASAPAATAETSKSARSYPYHGNLESVDAGGQSITLKGKSKNRVILVTSSTRIFRENRKASLPEGVPGERVSGSVRKNDEGKEVALTVRFGSNPKK